MPNLQCISYSSIQNCKLLDNDQILAELIQEISKLFCSNICRLVNLEKFKRSRKAQKKEKYNTKKDFQ
jgi:hypothetical protein